MTALEIAENIAKVFEGLILRPYMCPAGVPTIGFGTTRYPDGRKVTLNDMPITPQQAVDYMDYELKNCLSAALRHCPRLICSPQKLGAITDFVYNLGAGRLQTSTLRRRINRGDWDAAGKELSRWTRGGGRVLPGLVARRKVEKQYLTQ